MDWLKRLVKGADWLLLIPGAAGLILLSWPVGPWHLWSFLWIGVLLLVLLDEIIGAFFSPVHKSISNQMRDYRKSNPVRFWLIMTVYLFFSWSLIVHLAT